MDIDKLFLTKVDIIVHLQTARDVGMSLNEALLKSLMEEGNIKNRKYMGFLR